MPLFPIVENIDEFVGLNRSHQHPCQKLSARHRFSTDLATRFPIHVGIPNPERTVNTLRSPITRPKPIVIIRFGVVPKHVFAFY